MKESTYNRTRALYHSMGPEDRAHFINEALTTMDEIGLHILGHVLDRDSVNAFQRAMWLLEKKRTAPDYFNARRLAS